MSCSSSTATSATQTPTYELNDININGEIITESDIAQEVQHHPSGSIEEAVYEATNALVIQCLLRQEATEKGFLKAGVTEENAISELLNTEAYAPEATENECHRYFMANREKFCTSPLVEVSHILLASDPKDLKDRITVKETALGLLEKLKSAPNQFEDFARQYSSCPSKETLGSLGQLSKGQTVAEFEKVVFALNEGIAEHPVETRYGFHIVQVHNHIDGNPLDYEMVEDKIKQYLNEKTQRKAISQYIEVLFGNATIDGFAPKMDGSPLMQ
jgi:peptidyl-prolyl cis-trans isomerase C